MYLIILLLLLVSIQSNTHNHNHNRGVDLNEDKNIVLTTSENVVKIWNLKTGKQTSVLKVHTGDIMCFYYNIDREYLFTGSLDKTIKVTDINTLKTIKTISVHTKVIVGIVVYDR